MMFKYWDIMVFDKEDLPVLVAKVIKVKPFNKERQLFYYQRVHKYAKRIGVGYVLIVAPSKIQLWNPSNDEVLAEFDTAIALCPYIRKESTVEKVSKDYLKGLVMLWLDDLILSWKEEEAPYKEELKALGILEQLENVQMKIEDKV